MFGIDNLIGDFVGSLYGAKGPYKRGVSGSPRRSAYNIGYKQPSPLPSVSYIPSNSKNDSIRDAKEAMKYGGIDKFRF